MTNASHQNDLRPVIVVVPGPTIDNAPVTVASLGIRLHVIPDRDAWRDWAYGLATCGGVPADCEALLRQVLDRFAEAHDDRACSQSSRPSTK